jgi:hypothetical protein
MPVFTGHSGVLLMPVVSILIGSLSSSDAVKSRFVAVTSRHILSNFAPWLPLENGHKKKPRGRGINTARAKKGESYKSMAVS